MKNLIINIDDLGLSHHVNQAVVNLANKGRISASSYMVGGDISNEHKQALEATGVDIGLHLDFTGIFNSPLTATLKQILLNSYTHQLDNKQVANNVKQQFDQFENTFGYAPVFVDGHQHVHQFPIIRDALIDEMTQRQITQARITKPLVNDLKSWITYTLGGNAWAKICQKHDISTNTGFAGVYGFDKDFNELKSLWQTWLANCPSHTNTSATSLIMCHPAVPVKQGDIDYQDGIKSAREIEYNWLMSDEFEEMLKVNKINIVNWHS